MKSFEVGAGLGQPELAPGRSSDPDVAAPADRILAEQGVGIDSYQLWQGAEMG